ncbi:MAG: DUF1345 domain-containing protein [Kineosporiaceae bacterium]|nr:DUF1345 domain-containing protein [Kineosporiaceae bacterium]
MQLRETMAQRRSGLRLLAAALVGGVAGAAWYAVAGHGDYALAVGWSVGAMAYLARTWSVIGAMDATRTAAHAAHEEASGMLGTEFAVLLACVASLVAVGHLLLGGGSGDRLVRGLLGVLVVVLSWVVVHTVYTVRYARLYYSGPDGGIDFAGTEPARYSDFAYVAFTLGMTYQVSDTNLSSGEIRRTALVHCLLSYVFGTVVLATTVNVVIGLAAAG